MGKRAALQELRSIELHRKLPVIIGVAFAECHLPGKLF